LGEENVGTPVTQTFKKDAPGVYMDPKPTGVRYERKEIREMTELEWKQYADALWTMKTMSQDELREKYGGRIQKHMWVTRIIRRHQPHAPTH
jgi:hypothetical protein